MAWVTDIHPKTIIHHRAEVEEIKDWHTMEIEEVLRELKTDLRKGFSHEEAKIRLKKHGCN